MMQLLQVSDDSGFLAIIDPDAYQGFVDENWELVQLRATMREQMAARTLLVWGTGSENTWKVDLRRGFGEVAGFRQTMGTIVSLRGRLLVTNYESLTMAAQYRDETLPQRHETDCVVTVDPGSYLCRITQLRNPDDLDDAETTVDFIVELAASNQAEPAWTDIPWSER